MHTYIHIHTATPHSQHEHTHIHSRFTLTSMLTTQPFHTQPVRTLIFVPTLYPMSTFTCSLTLPPYAHSCAHLHTLTQHTFLLIHTMPRSPKWILTCSSQPTLTQHTHVQQACTCSPLPTLTPHVHSLHMYTPHVLASIPQSPNIYTLSFTPSHVH